MLTSVPNIISDNVKFRISRNGIVDESDASLTIIDVPTNLSVYWPCPDSINASWSAVNGATSYEVSMLGRNTWIQFIRLITQMFGLLILTLIL